MFSRDILNLICFKLDSKSLLNFCLTSKEIYNKIFLDNIFWMNKIKHDFGLIYYNKKDYIYFNDYVQKFKTNNALLNYGINKRYLDLCSIAYYRGLEYKKIDTCDEAKKFIKSILDYTELLNSIKEEKAKVIIDLFEKYLIDIGYFLNEPKIFWEEVLKKLEEFKHDKLFGMERYNKLINFYKQKLM